MLCRFENRKIILDFEKYALLLGGKSVLCFYLFAYLKMLPHSLLAIA